MTKPDLTPTEAVRELAVASATAAAMIVADALAAGAQLVLPGDLVGPGDAAEIIGVNRTTVPRWVREGYMPTPLQNVGGVPVWTRDVVVAFAAEHHGRADAVGRRPISTAAAASR